MAWQRLPLSRYDAGRSHRGARRKNRSPAVTSEQGNPTWLSICSERLVGHALYDFVLETLCCFDEPHPRSDEPHPPELTFSGSLEELIATHSDSYEHLLEGDWQQEVDRGQADLLIRRLTSVDELLLKLPESGVEELVIHILRLGLHIRLEQIVQAGVLPAIRLRALADFYYSRAVLLTHGLDHLYLQDLREQAARSEWQPVHTGSGARAGIWQSYYAGDQVWGPQQISALKVDLRQYRLEAIDLRVGEDVYDGLTQRLADLGAVAGSSGGFFLYSEPDIEPPSARHDPVGMILREGRILHPPIANRAALLFADREIALRRVGLADVELRHGELELDLSRAVIRADADWGPDLPSLSVVGNQVCATGRSLPVPLNGLVVPWPTAYGAPPEVGTELQWTGPQLRDGLPAQEGLSGGPLLLSDGKLCIDYRAEGFWGSAPPQTFSQDETGDRNLLARLVLGTDADDYLYLVAVDGRQVQHALGLSLQGSAAWMQGLGCTHAANMDGGSSKRLMLHGEVMDSPTTEVAHGAPCNVRVRPVYSGIAIIPR